MKKIATERPPNQYFAKKPADEGAGEPPKRDWRFIYLQQQSQLMYGDRYQLNILVNNGTYASSLAIRTSANSSAM